MRKYSLKIRLLLYILLIAFIFPGYTITFEEDVDFGKVDKDHFVYDRAGVYTDREEKKLQEKCKKLGEELGLDIIIVTTNNLGFGNGYASDSTIDMYESKYAEAFYLNGGFDDGILYLLDLDYDGIYVIRSGMAEVYIDNADNEQILDAIWDDFLDYDYYDAALSFIREVDDIVSPRLNDEEFQELREAWEDGDYKYYDEFYMDYKTAIRDAHEDTLFTPFRSIGNCILIGGIIGLITVIIILCNSGSKMTVGARSYIKSGSLRLLQRFDRYTHTTTHSYRINTSSGGGGGRSGGGFSSSHRSSFGGRSRSFSGGGRRR